MQNNPHIYELLIRESHLDTFGHVNNAVYLELMEEARWDLITANDYGLEKVQLSNLGPVILDITLKFRHELRLREKIRIETRALDYRKKIGRLEQKLYNSQNVLSAEAVFTYGLFDLVQRKLVDPTEEWMRAIGMAPAPARPF